MLKYWWPSWTRGPYVSSQSTLACRVSRQIHYAHCPAVLILIAQWDSVIIVCQLDWRSLYCFVFWWRHWNILQLSHLFVSILRKRVLLLSMRLTIEVLPIFFLLSAVFYSDVVYLILSVIYNTLMDNSRILL